MFLAAAFTPSRTTLRETESGAAFRAVCFVARLAKGDGHWLRLASRIPSRKAAVATVWDLIRGSLIDQLEMNLPACPANSNGCRLADFGNRVFHPLHSDHFNTVQRLLGLVGFGNQRLLEAQLGRFLETLLTALHRPDFTGQPHFAEHH